MPEEEMKAGRELDRLVAIHIFKLENVDYYTEKKSKKTGWHDLYYSPVLEGQKRFKPYLEDIDHAVTTVNEYGDPALLHTYNWKIFEDNEWLEDTKYRTIAGHPLYYVPDFSTDIADAWKVVEHFTWPHHYVSLQKTNRGNWRCDIELHGGDGPTVSDYDKDAPAAICRAALKAVNAGEAKDD